MRGFREPGTQPRGLPIGRVQKGAERGGLMLAAVKREQLDEIVAEALAGAGLGMGSQSERASLLFARLQLSLGLVKGYIEWKESL